MRKKLVQSDLGIQLPEEAARRADALLKSLPENERKLRRKMAIPSLELVPGERADISILTSEALDTDREVMIAKGVDYSLYMQNPVVCWHHDQQRPVAKCMWIKPVDNLLKAKTQYPSKPDSYEGEWFTDEVYALIQADILRGKSVGVLVTQMDSPSPVELKAHPEWKSARIIRSCSMFEYSVCAIGANPDAVVQAVAKGITLSPELMHWIGKPTKKASQQDIMAQVLEKLQSLDVAGMVDKAMKAYANRGKV